MMTQEGVSNKDLDDFESYIMKAQEEEEEQEEEDITSSSSSDELDAMEKLVMNAKEESEEPFSEEPLYSMSNGLDDLEDMIEGAKEQDKDENRVNPYDTDTTPDNVQIDISTTTLTENKVTTNVAEYQQEQMEEEEERLDELLFALSDANGLEPASQSSVRSKSPPPRISAVSSSRVQNGQPESSSIITSHVETHHNGVEPEDSMFENMEIHESEIPLPVQPPRKKVKRQLPESLPHDITRRSGLPTAESASGQTDPLFLNSSSVNKRRITDPQPNAVRLTEKDFDKPSIIDEPLATNVKNTSIGKILLSNVRSLPNISVVVGPPDSADEYEWSDSGLTPPSSPEGGAETFPVHIPAAVRQMSAAEPESEHIRAAIRQMSMADSLPSRVPADIRRSSVAAGNAIRSSTRGKMSVSPDFSQPRRPETSHHAEQKQNFSPSTIPRDEPRRAPFKTGKRKVRIPWSSRELDALESGLDLLGWGQWMDIKKLNYNILKDRDNVAIKDKARNEALRRQKERIPLGPYCGCPFIADS